MYKLNTHNAKKAGGGGRISETGLYLVTITAAFAVKSSAGTDGVEMMVKTDDGLSADYLQIWLKNAKGEELSGMNVFHAIMACCEIREATIASATITRNNEQERVDMLRELVNQRVYLGLEREPYTKNDGTAGFSMVVAWPLEASTKRTAKEKLESVSVAKAHEGLVGRLKDRQGRKPKGAAAQQPAAFAGAGPDDDIPF